MSKTNDRGSHKTGRVPLAGTRLTAAVSVAMVLLLGGIVAAIGVAARSVARDIRELTGFTVVMDDAASPAQVAALKQRFLRDRRVASFAYSSPAEVLARWQALLGDDENIEELLDGDNPFAPEFEVHVRESVASADSLELMTMPLRRQPGVSSVKIHAEMANNIDDAVRASAITLSAVALVLLVISFVLINNTVRLTIHSRRFSIWTMRLVGATGGFIRRPLVLESVLTGLCSGLLSAGLLAALLWWAASVEPVVATLVPWWPAATIIMASMVVAGMLICALASAVAVNRFLRATQARLYR